ncbi:hypothetical protein TTHERM_00841330 (macronuclear) [Tetrahymena thermophila SB210]|uniref:Uncharacterized protein n=1 Tax=Tetrahymena thermophila (strain SB210) TaxID=312017 RepID=I7MAZ6_TETTS|nr:hypothetical protein TTHERM_00841330 [Tetrahymena thermophila SB210]EAS07006.2 hypothetical protein TTHERM_00841330 [Tetrahymena thermophila SB210]|eukprot:XP_001027248.2 hypothetical protein TTHERM_00841330 [Tetrahymena thermophila SB210]
MEMKTIIKSELDRKNLIWESIKDLKKNLNSSYSTNTSAYNTQRSLKPNSQSYQYPSNNEMTERCNQDQEIQESNNNNKFRLSFKQKENAYSSNHSQEECHFSKIDTNLLEIPQVNEQSFSTKNSNEDNAEEFNEFRRVPSQIKKLVEGQEDNQNEYRRYSQNSEKKQNYEKNFNEQMTNMTNNNDTNQQFKNNNLQNINKSIQLEGSYTAHSNNQEQDGYIQQISPFRKQKNDIKEQFVARNICEVNEFKKTQNQSANDQIELNQILQKENQDLKNLISKVRKECHQRIQSIQKEFEEQLKENNAAHEESIKILQLKFQEELASKEEDLQTFMLVYQEEQQKSQKDESIKESQDYEEAQKKISLLQAQLEESIKEKNQLSEHNINLTQEFEHLKNQNLQNLKDKQNELNMIGEKYEKEIQSLKKEMNDKILQTNQENLKKIDIFVKENIRLEDQLSKFEALSKEQQKQIQTKDIQLESLKNELKQAKDLLEIETKKQQQALPIKPDTFQTNPKMQIQPQTKRSQVQLDDINSHSYQTLVTKRDENEKENIRINQIITPQVPSKNIYEQDKALKNLLAKINDFIEQKDTKESSDVVNKECNHLNESNLNESQQSIHKSSLNNHYNKKLRILRVNNHNTSLNISYTQPTENHRRGQSLINQSLNESCSGVGIAQQQTHLRNFSIERESNIRNPYLLDAADSHRSQFFPHSRSNSNLNTQRRAISTHINTAQMCYQQKSYDREQFQYNNYAHNRSFFSDSDTSKGNLDFLSINQNIGNNYLSSKESPLRIDEEYSSIQQKKQQKQIQSQISQDLSIISRAPYNENYSSCLNEYNYMSNKLQDKIEVKLSNQQQVYKLQEKENQPQFANNYNQFANSLGYDQNQIDLKQERKKFQSTQEIQQKLSLWDNMDTLAVDDEEQNGFMNTIKDLHSKIRLIKK